MNPSYVWVKASNLFQQPLVVFWHSFCPNKLHDVYVGDDLTVGRPLFLASNGPDGWEETDIHHHFRYFNRH